MFHPIDGKLFEETTDFPYSASWKPQVGKHSITAYGVTRRSNEKIKSEDVGFSVVEFKEDGIH